MKALDVLIKAALIGLGAGYVVAKLPPEVTLSEEDLARMHTVEASVYYPGCNAARAAGVAPIHRGEPGYREGMDGDLDGIACEPWR